MEKESTVAVIYQCDYQSDKVIRNRPKLQRRLQRAIADMAEDGFSNFILPLEKPCPFASVFADAFIAEKALDPTINLTIMVPFEEDLASNSFDYAFQTIFCHKEYTPSEPIKITENLLHLSGGLILYFERNCSKLRFTSSHALQHRWPLININI